MNHIELPNPTKIERVYDIKIKPSSISNAGNGVFANEYIPKGIIFGFYDGIIVKGSDKKKIDKLGKLLVRVTNYNLLNSKNKSLTAGFPKLLHKCGFGQLLNDYTTNKILRKNKNYNCEYYYDNSHTIYVKSIKSIKKGKELFSNYGQGYWDSRFSIIDINEKKFYNNLYKDLPELDTSTRELWFNSLSLYSEFINDFL